MLSLMKISMTEYLSNLIQIRQADGLNLTLAV